MSKYLVIICIGTLTMGSGCKKQCLAGHINPQLYADYHYNIGSYWVYKDSISGRVDSFYVSFSELVKGDCNRSAFGNYDYWVAYVKEVNLSGGFTIDTVNTWGLTMYLAELDMSNHASYLFSFIRFTYFQDRIGTYYLQDSMQGIQLPTLIINGDAYTNVFETRYFHNNIKNDAIFMSPTAGIVKMSFDHGIDTANNIPPLKRVWELQRYKIIR